MVSLLTGNERKAYRVPLEDHRADVKVNFDSTYRMQIHVEHTV